MAWCKNAVTPLPQSCTKPLKWSKTLRMYDDVIKWKYFLCYWPFVRGIHQSLVDSPHKGQWRGALMFSLIYAWSQGWANNWAADDLRCHYTHYNVTVMTSVEAPCVSCSVYAQTSLSCVPCPGPRHMASLKLWLVDSPEQHRHLFYPSCTCVHCMMGKTRMISSVPSWLLWNFVLTLLVNQFVSMKLWNIYEACININLEIFFFFAYGYIVVDCWECFCHEMIHNDLLYGVIDTKEICK